MSRRLSVLLDAHATALAACSRCSFDDPTIRPVVSSSRAPLAMLIGQAPGKTEVVDRRPFAGRAGRTLFRWFSEVGITEEVVRRRIYIAAVTRCFPGPSPSGRGDRVPSHAEISNCASWLEAEIALIRPRLIIPVGRLAIERFLGMSPLSELVGREHRVTDLPGRPVAVPLPHPSGASSWIHGPGHMQLVRTSLEIIAARLPQLVRESERARSVA
jgi:uracil-DNA glycosylase